MNTTNRTSLSTIAIYVAATDLQKQAIEADMDKVVTGDGVPEAEYLEGLQGFNTPEEYLTEIGWTPPTPPTADEEEGTENKPEEGTKPDVPLAKLTAIQVEFQNAERLLQAKYPHLKIVKGSLVQDVAHPVYSNKRRVKVICPGCGCTVERATSDLHTFKGCPTCLKSIRKAEKSAKKLRLVEAMAAMENNTDGDDGADDSAQS